MKTCVILLNWNGWKDTIECLESVFRLDAIELQVVVCDNGSGDGSLAYIRQWANGELSAHCASPPLARLSQPPVPKPIPYRELSRVDAELGTAAATAWNVPLILIQNGANLGFAAGTNVGIRYALHDPCCRFFWILNNDTVVDPGALAAMILCLETNSQLGLCGSISKSYDDPAQILTRGGRLLNRWTGRTFKSRSLPDTSRCHSDPIDYVEGSSMLASRAFLEKVGLMEESYFLYFEELDWAMRARQIMTLTYSSESVIYHKEGASIGSHSDRSRRSFLSEQYLSRSRVLFTRRFFPWALPSVLGSLFLAAGYHVVRGDLKRAFTIVRWTVKGLLAPKTTMNQTSQSDKQRVSTCA
jgi:hypothetical protein